MPHIQLHSPERDAVMREHWEAGMRACDILKLVNEVPPGKDFPMAERTMQNRIRKLRITRPETYPGMAYTHGKSGKKINSLKPTPQYFQQPPPINRMKRLSRDGLPSLAAFELASHAQRANRAPCDWDTAREWGLKWVKTEDLKAINDFRVENKLPIFEISS